MFTPGDPSSDEIYFVSKGRIRIHEPDETGGQRESIVEAFNSFGELGVLTHTPRSTTAEAEGDTVLYLLDRGDLREAAIGSEMLRQALRQLV